jgi:predicted permease
MHALLQDLRFALRGLARTPGFAVPVVLTLGLAIGANATVYSLIDRVALRPLPVERPSELVTVNGADLPYIGPSLTGGRASMPYPLFASLRDHPSRLLAGMAAHHLSLFALQAGDGALELRGEFTSGTYFRVLGLKPLLGRTFTAQDDGQQDGPAIAVLNHGFWLRQFGGDPSVIHRTITLNKVPLTIVGVLAPGYSGMRVGMTPEVFVPLAMSGLLSPKLPGGLRWDSPGFSVLSVIARLAPGADRARAEREIDTHYQQLVADALAALPRMSPQDRQYYATHQSRLELLPGGTVGSQSTFTSRNLEKPLRLLLGMTVFVLLIAAGNVANLLVARGAARSHEVAIRFALGAGRWPLLRQRLVESLLLVIASGATALILALWTGDLVPTLLGLDTELAGINTEPDARVVVFTLAVSLASGFLVWLASAFLVTRRATVARLLAVRRSHGTAHSGLGLRRGLVVVQVALSLALVCSSLFLGRSLLNLLTIDPGFETRNLVAFTVNPGDAGYDRPRASRYVNQLLDGVRSLPGVTHASRTSTVPLAGASSQTWLFGARQADGQAKAPLVSVADVGPDYFATLGLPIVAGRPFDARDVKGAPLVAMVNETLARTLVGAGDPIGQMVGFEGQPRAIQIVGVVRDSRNRSIKAQVEPMLFTPAAQADGGGRAGIMVRTAGGGTLSRATVMSVVNRLDPSVTMTDFATLGEIVSRTLFRERMLAGLSLAFAGLSALLAAMGLFGLTSFSVVRRTREIGIRLALGAPRVSIERMILRQAIVLVVLGGTAGLAVFLAAGRYLRSLLFDLSPSDPATIALSVVALMGVAAVAGLLPARRAARLDPAVTLRCE